MINRMLTPSAALCAALMLASLASAQVALADPASEGLAIARQADEANGGFGGEISTVRMELVNASGDSVVRVLQLQVLEVPGDGDRSLVDIVEPRDVAGTRLLTWAHPLGQDDQWLYLPTLHSSKRISSANRAGSFMGSEFAFEDMGHPEPDRFTYRLVREEDCGAHRCSVLERRPVDRYSGYSRQLVWMDEVYASPVRIEFYDRKDELLKSLDFTGFQQHGRWWRAGEAEMRNLRTGRSTRLLWEQRELGVALPPEDFTLEGLD